MAQIVKLRRSSVSGQKPTNDNLQLGEIALNTTDGKAFMSVSGSDGPKVEEFILTNTVNTGSINLVGNISASNFNGSFIGDGSGLYNLTSDITSDRITSGSKEVIIDSNGVNINTDVLITGSLRVTSITGSIGWNNIQNIPYGIVSGSEQLTGSYDTRYILSGSITETTWDNIQSKPSGIVSGSSQITYSGITNIPSGIVSGSGQILDGSNVWSGSGQLPLGIVSGSEQLTGSYDTRYILSGSITETTWDNIANKPLGIISGSIQVDITETTGYSTFSSSIATTDLTQNNRLDSLETESGSIRNNFNSFTSSYTIVSNSLDNRLNSLETESGSIRNNFNSFTSSYTTVSSSLDNRLDILEAYSSSQLVPSSSMSFRTLQTDVYCKNVTGVQINKGTVVRIVGSVGDNPLIAVADSTTEHASANTLGITTVNIPNDSFGLVITEGTLIGVNTDGMTAGALLYLGANGIFTTTPPVAPNHGVRLGEVLRVQQNQGSIYVRIDNGIELNEAHDVIYTGITHGDLLIRSGSVWKNGKSLEGNYIVTGSLTISENLTVLGSSSITYITSSQLQVATSVISVNVFEPAERFGGLKVYDSGSLSHQATASLLWDSQNNHWIYQNASGSSYSGGMLMSGPRNTGSLGNEVGLINGRIAKSVGGDHLDNSIISETDTTITIDGDLVANSITGAFDFFGLVNKPTLVSGSSQINITGTTEYSTFSSSIATTTLNLSSSVGSLSSSIESINSTQNDRLDSIESLTGSITDLNSFTSSINTTIKSKLDSDGIVSGSSQITYSGITNIPSGIVSGSSQILDGSNVWSGSEQLPLGIVSGSEQLTGSYDTRYILSGSITETTWDNIANKPLGIVSGSEQLTGSYDNRYVLSGSITQTTWDNIENKPLGIVSGSEQLTGSYDTRYLLSGSISQTTWDNIENKPSDIVSGSSQIIYSGITNIPSGIVSGSGQIISLGLATTGSNVFIGNQVISGSLFTTGSNVFIGNQVISGSLSTSGSNVFRGNQVISGSLLVSGSGVFRGNQVISGSLTTTGSITTTNGDFRISNGSLAVGGNITNSVTKGRIDASNDIVAFSTSDRRLKENIHNIDTPMDKISKLNGVEFNWREEYFTIHGYKGKDVGVIAQELFDVLPEAIRKNETGYLSVRYEKIIPLLIECIKELNNEIILLKNK